MALKVQVKSVPDFRDTLVKLYEQKLEKLERQAKKWPEGDVNKMCDDDRARLLKFLVNELKGMEFV